MWESEISELKEENRCLRDENTALREEIEDLKQTIRNYSVMNGLLKRSNHRKSHIRRRF